MKGGTVYFDGSSFNTPHYADEYSRLEAVMLNNLYERSPSAKTFLGGIPYHPEIMFNSNALYLNHAVLAQIYAELGLDQQQDFIGMLRAIVQGRLDRRGNLDRGHANQAILMNNVLIFFGDVGLDMSSLTTASRAVATPTFRGRNYLVSRVARHAATEGARWNVRRAIRRRTARDVARDAARTATRRTLRGVARHAATEGARWNAIRSLRRQSERISNAARDVARDAAREATRIDMQREAAQPEEPISTTLKRRITALFNAGTYDSNFTLHEVLIHANQWKSTDMFTDDDIIEILNDELGRRAPQTKKRKRD